MVDQGMTDAGDQMRLANARRPEGQQVVTLGKPSIGFGKRHDMGLGDGRYGREVEARQTLVRRQVAVDPSTRQSSCLAFMHFLLQQHPEEALCGPAFAVGLLGHGRPHPLDRGQSQFGEHQRQARCVGGGACGSSGRGCGHAASSNSS